MADVVRGAQYEVLFVTMQWDAPSEVSGPGDALTRAIADLYEKVKANPLDYPRGMTVRIMLGNLPETTLLSFSSQLHHVIVDLKEAGLDLNPDPEIGWQVELAAIGGAQESVDLFEVNFSMESVCIVLAQLGDLCSEEEFAPPYMIALRDAILENDVHIRVMMEESAMNGIENRAGIRWFKDELAGTGKEENLDMRFSANKMHNKALLVDQEFLSIGSQNFHFSTWGSPSLTEYNLATDDPAAVEEFLTEFEYWWSLAIPVEELME